MVAPDPPFDDELVHRWIVAAESSACRFVLIANKRDLPDVCGHSTAARAIRRTRLSGRRDLRERRCRRPSLPLLAGQHSVLIGQSGMGKSTLINRMLPGAAARVGEVSAALHTGRHTTTETTLYPIDASSWIVDSPGHEGVRPRTPLGRRDRARLRRVACRCWGPAAFAIAATTASPVARSGKRSRAARSSRGDWRCCSSCSRTAGGARRPGEASAPRLRRPVGERKHQQDGEPYQQRPPDQPGRARENVAVGRFADADLGPELGLAGRAGDRAADDHAERARAACQQDAVVQGAAIARTACASNRSRPRSRRRRRKSLRSAAPESSRANAAGAAPARRRRSIDGRAASIRRRATATRAAPSRGRARHPPVRAAPGTRTACRTRGDTNPRAPARSRASEFPRR